MVKLQSLSNSKFLKLSVFAQDFWGKGIFHFKTFPLNNHRLIEILPFLCKFHQGRLSSEVVLSLLDLLVSTQAIDART